MKTLKIIFGKALLVIGMTTVVLFSSCSDLLDKEPITELSSGNSLQTESDFVALTNSIYDPLQWQVINSPQTHHYPVMWQDIRADNCISQWASFWAAGAALDDFDLIRPNSPSVASLWQKWYTMISRANTAIEFINGFGGFETEGLQDRLIAEAKFMRAFAYFELMKMWGDVPLITTYIGGTEDQLIYSRSPKAEVYTQIETDLTEAAPALATKGTVELDRATQGAAYTLLAKVHLYQEEYDQVVEYTEMVMEMGYDLEADFSANFNMNTEHGIESIFEIGYADGFSNIAFESSQARTNQGSSAYQMFGFIFNGAVGGFGNGVPRQSLIDLYDDTDIRKAATFVTPNSVLENGPQSCNCLVFNDDGSPVFGDDGNESQWVGTDIYNYFWVVGTPAWESRASMKKYLLPQAVSPELLNLGSSPLNEKVFRYADVLLMHAEASLFSNGNVDGLSSLNAVIQRAYGGDNSNNLGTYTLDDVKLERRKELATEGWDRFTDLVRWGDAATALAFKGFQAGRDELLPIPQGEIDLVGADVLSQNPGY
jgi:hypothetical protein